MKRKRRPPCPVWSMASPEYATAYGWKMRGLAIAPSSVVDLDIGNSFMRGFISAGLIAVTASRAQARKNALRLALQGGAAMAAGVASADALDRREYGSALLAVAAGAVGLGAINRLLPPSPSKVKEDTHE